MDNIEGDIGQLGAGMIGVAAARATRLIREPNDDPPFYYPPSLARQLHGKWAFVIGAFRTPGLRNVELTPPFFHNGFRGEKGSVDERLEDAVDLYNDPRKNRHLHPEIREMAAEGFNQAELDALVAFLKTLTDERVRNHSAPFDHPSINVPKVREVNAQGASDRTALVEIPAR